MAAIFQIDDIFKCIFWDEDAKISIKISLEFGPKGPFNNISAASDEIMAGVVQATSHYLNQLWQVYSCICAIRT